MESGSVFDKDDWYFCLPQKDDSVAGGRIRRVENQFEFILYSRETLSGLKEATSLALILETGQLVFLADVYISSVAVTNTFDRLHSISGFAPHGYVTSNPNPDLSSVLWASFQSEFSDFHIDNGERAEAIDLKADETPDTTIFEVELKDCTVSFKWGVSFSLHRGPALSEPWVEVQFVKPTGLEAINQIIFRIMVLFAALKGAPVGLSNLSLELKDDKSASDQDIVPSIGRYYPAFEFERSRDPRKFPLLSVYDDDSASLFSEILHYWLSLGPDWDDAVVATLKYTRQRGVFSGDRLLDACRWLEDIPGSDALHLLSKDEFSELISPALDAFADGETKSRAKSALDKLRYENHRQRVRRLVSEITTSGLDEEQLVTRVVSGLRRRGKYAHGHASEETQQSFEELVTYTLSIELLCFALMFKPYFGRFGKFIGCHPAWQYFNLKDGV